MTINTKRLILRPWTEEDLEPFAKLNAEARIREFFLGLLSRQESDTSVKLVSEHIQRCGWGFWAASLVETGEFIGFIGLENVYFSAPFNKSAPAPVPINDMEHLGENNLTIFTPIKNHPKVIVEAISLL